MNFPRWAIFAGLPSLVLGACGGQDFSPPRGAGGAAGMSVEAGGGKADIWRAQRRDPTAAFDAPTNVDELNSVATDYVGWLSEDNCRLYLSSNRVTASRSYEVYVAKR